MLLFAAATQGWFLAKNRFYESIALLLIAFTLFRPGFWMDMVFPPYSEEAPAEIAASGRRRRPRATDLRLRVRGVNDLGDPIEFVAILPIGEGATGEEKLDNAGLVFRNDGDKMFIDDVAFGSPAADAGLDWDQEVLRVLQPVDQPSKYWMFIPGAACCWRWLSCCNAAAHRPPARQPRLKETTMYDNILLTIDLNHPASWEKALPEAVALARDSKGKLACPDRGARLRNARWFRGSFRQISRKRRLTKAEARAAPDHRNRGPQRRRRAGAPVLRRDP